MKFGILVHKNALNFGDDVQAYAISKFLPEIDYFVDREHLNSFRSENDEPVAVIMCAWYMWHKWNWPPSDCIIPLLTSMHYSDHQLGKQPGSPVKYEFLTGLGGEYMNSYGPVGCRDMFTLEHFKELGIDSYFSGCITLTMPQMPILKPQKEYVCAVDLFPEGLEKLKELLDGTGIEIKSFTHNKKKRNPDGEWEKVSADVEERLTIYQNAKCVITRRLHCALPCLGMKVPVFVINDGTPEGLNRFDPYINWFAHCTPDEFLAGQFEYNFADPPANSDLYLDTREKLAKSVTDFVDEYRNKEGKKEDFVKTTYTSQQLVLWHNRTMNECMDMWYKDNRANLLKLKKQEETLEKNNLQIADKNKKIKKLSADADKNKAEIVKLKKKLEESKAAEKKLKTQIESIEKEKGRLSRIIHCRSVRMAIKLRNLFCGKKKKIKI